MQRSLFPAGIVAFVALCASTAAAAPPPAPPAGSKYVALGTSYASGPRITKRAETPINRCNRTLDNYPHQIAAKHGLVLTDVTCGGGATTAHVLGPWNELKAQVDSLEADTRLVTLSIGRNDLRMTATLSAGACQTYSANPPPGKTPPAQCAAMPASPTEAEWAAVEAGMRRIADEVHRRAPQARLVFVDDPTLLPQTGTCADLSLTEVQVAADRINERRLALLTAKVARETGSDLIAASAITADHGVCSSAPWSSGAVTSVVDLSPFHPRLEAHTAIAEAVGRLVWR